MMPDHYGTLGVEPTASAAAIRTAYLGLMREFHPDRNPSPEAVARAQAAIAAFKVLSDFDQRNHYDWDRRREREAAAVLAAQRPRGKRAGALAAGAAGLAAAGAWLLLPAPSLEPGPSEPRVTVSRPAPVAKTRIAPLPKRIAVTSPAKAKVEKREPVARVEPRSPPVREAKVELVRAMPKVERAPVVREAAVKAPPPRTAPASPSPRAVKAVARPARPAPKPATELASIDQFVMNFYGQSWRHGDAPKRAALVQSRNKFVARRGECAADECRRAAYLKLMREVSEIVESGEPKTR